MIVVEGVVRFVMQLKGLLVAQGLPARWALVGFALFALSLPTARRLLVAACDFVAWRAWNDEVACRERAQAEKQAESKAVLSLLSARRRAACSVETEEEYEEVCADDFSVVQAVSPAAGQDVPVGDSARTTVFTKAESKAACARLLKLPSASDFARVRDFRAGRRGAV
ncbi:MAG: hypothetical protein JWN04_4491 [Myxococcaceae bacterium]|nr:hypothetical protein [Myxococcaceae bacterium]